MLLGPTRTVPRVRALRRSRCGHGQDWHEPMRTLVVEDDDTQRALLISGLQELGHEVEAVADGDAGLLAHLREPYELLVIDWVMPKMDGLTLCHRIRAIPNAQQPYVLMVTGRDRPQDLAAVLDAGADDYIAKPMEVALLHTRVRIAEQRVAHERRHRQAREALARSEVEFRRVIERCPLGVMAFRNHNVVYVNDAGAKALGAERGDLVGRSVEDLMTHGDGDLTARRLERFERTEVPPPPMECTITRTNAAPMTAWVIPVTQALLDGERATFMMFEDITERRAAERELRLTQFAIDHAADPALWLSRAGRIAYVNHAACLMLGYPRNELEGKSVCEIDIAMVGTTPVGWAAGVTGTSKTLFRTASGRTVPVEVSTNVLSFDGEEFVVAFARDLSERERMAANLQKADRLASVGSLAAGVAHEINNPLAYVIANLEVLHEDLNGMTVEGGDVMRRSLREALDGADRVRRIVGDLKSFARADDDEVQAVDVHEVIDAAADIASNEIRHRAELVRQYGDVPRVRGNPGRLTQVFLNLLVNAAHAIDEGQPQQRITIRTREQSDGVMVEVSDTGSGISDEMVDRIFDPFFTTKPLGMGTGLGLSICHGIINALGGEIRVDTHQGEGSTFRVFLRKADARNALPELRPRLGGPSGPAPIRALRILVVDDEPLIGEGIRRALRGHDVEIARGGREAVERCETSDFDLVLCDVMMPDLSGMEVYGKLRLTKPGLEAKFVFMTGGAFTPKARDFLEKVQAEHLEKPFSLRELRTLVNRRAERN